MAQRQQQRQQHGVEQQPARLLTPQQLFSTAAGEAALHLLYAATLAALPFSYEDRWVQTASFGRDHVVVCGPPAGHPLLLWHGSTAPPPYMLCTPSLRLLVDRFRVYCPDLPCHGKLFVAGQKRCCRWRGYQRLLGGVQGQPELDGYGARHLHWQARILLC